MNGEQNEEIDLTIRAAAGALIVSGWSEGTATSAARIVVTQLLLDGWRAPTNWSAPTGLATALAMGVASAFPEGWVVRVHGEADDTFRAILDRILDCAVEVEHGEFTYGFIREAEASRTVRIERTDEDFTESSGVYVVVPFDQLNTITIL